MPTEYLHGPGFSIALDERPGFLHALVSGEEDTLAVSIAYWSAIGKVCQQRGARSILVIENLPPFDDPRPEVFEAVTDAMANAGLRGVRVAFVDAREEVQANEYGMLIGAEKGLSIMMFSNESYAERWLRFGSPSERG